MRILIGIMVVICAATNLSAAPIGFATDNNTTLYSVDFSTATATSIGSTGQFFESLAISPSGQLFGATSGGLLYSVNSTTAAATLIGDTGLGNIEGLDFNGSTLLATDFSSTPRVYSLDTATAAPTLVVTAASNTGDVRAMTVLDSNTLLIRGDSPGPNSLYSLNLTTGAVSLRGNTNDFYAALDFASNGALYALFADGSLGQIDPNTAAVTTIGNTGGQFWLSLAAPAATEVPEPASLFAWGGAAFLLAGMRRRWTRG
jgi:hypothetical protein